MSDSGWRCFHCRQVFMDESLARQHFGESPVEFPTCITDRQHGIFGGPHDPYIPVRRDFIADMEMKIHRYERTLKSLRGYVACEGRPDGYEIRVGLANGSVWGPCADPMYEMYELAENIEKWLHEKCDEALKDTLIMHSQSAPNSENKGELIN